MARTVRIMLVVLSVCGALAAVLSANSSAAVRPADRTALIRGAVELCISSCQVGGYGYCTRSQGCVTADRVAAMAGDGRLVATVHLHDHRFKLNLIPGRYTLELLGDGKHVHGQVFQRQKVRALADRTTHVYFRFQVY
jgi:hypothetical protein